MGSILKPRTVCLPVAALAMALTAGLAGPTLPVAQAQDHPTPNAGANTWELSIKYEAPRVVVVDGKWHWVMPYTVTNNARLTVNYWPSCTVQGDNGQIIESPKVVNPAVFETVAKAIGGKNLVNPTEVAGPIRQGDDFARRSFFIWADFKEDVDHFAVFIEGLSGETQSFVHPETGETIRVHRNLMVEYATPGESKNPHQVRVQEVGRQYVMR